MSPAHTEVGTAGYTTLQTSRTGAILTVTINNKASNVNLLSKRVFFELDQLVTYLPNDTSTKVVLFESKNPTFFAAHVDLIQRPEDDNLNVDAHFATNVLFNITGLPQATIAVIDGPARGIGSEFVFACDMRFASKNAIFGNFEVALGNIPGAGGASYMPQLIGRGRAFEYLLSGKDIDAFTAETYGWVNKAFSSSSDLYKYANELAARIALFPAAALVSIKASVNSITRPTRDQVESDAREYVRLSQTPERHQFLKKFLALTNNGTDVAVELDLGEEVVKLYH
ncbi:hypothetical protein HIM_05632 [Hirsutella minnesotensis 3608]|uniref:Enoyl-CoA hydratase n=1 Tax=Hirsutella minnesotensis 3608 TaxID=1043627 RepID=A0A0F7ZK21_9HYPO|nr:hypothetical protein HIM_05632 [Hirsutella minnesotensis 3608]